MRQSRLFQTSFKLLAFVVEKRQNGEGTVSVLLVVLPLVVEVSAGEVIAQVSVEARPENVL